jgi:hypothetical protein
MGDTVILKGDTAETAPHHTALVSLKTRLSSERRNGAHDHAVAYPARARFCETIYSAHSRVERLSSACGQVGPCNEAFSYVLDGACTWV